MKWVELGRVQRVEELDRVLAAVAGEVAVVAVDHRQAGAMRSPTLAIIIPASGPKRAANAGRSRSLMAQNWPLPCRAMVGYLRQASGRLRCHLGSCGSGDAAVFVRVGDVPCAALRLYVNCGDSGRTPWSALCAVLAAPCGREEPSTRNTFRVVAVVAAAFAIVLVRSVRRLRGPRHRTVRAGREYGRQQRAG